MARLKVATARNVRDGASGVNTRNARSRAVWEPEHGAEFVFSPPYSMITVFAAKASQSKLRRAQSRNDVKDGATGFNGKNVHKRAVEASPHERGLASTELSVISDARVSEKKLNLATILLAHNGLHGEHTLNVVSHAAWVRTSVPVYVSVESEVLTAPDPAKMFPPAQSRKTVHLGRNGTGTREAEFVQLSAVVDSPKYTGYA